MSRIGKMPITVPAGVEVTIADGNVVTVKGPKGTLTQAFHPEMIIKQDGNVLTVARPDDEQLPSAACTALTRTLLHNMVVGVDRGLYKGAGGQRRWLPCTEGRQEARDEPGLFPSGHRRRDRRHRRSKSRLPTRSSSRALTSRVVGQFAAECPQRRDRPNPTRARVSSYANEVIRLQGRQDRR